MRYSSMWTIIMRRMMMTAVMPVSTFIGVGRFNKNNMLMWLNYMSMTV
jgi:hypothetical protein